jgi:hypothetical protein
MGGALVVVRPFGRFKIGAIIADPALIKATLAGEHAHYVVRLAGLAIEGAKGQGV